MRSKSLLSALALIAATGFTSAALAQQALPRASESALATTPDSISISKHGLVVSPLGADGGMTITQATDKQSASSTQPTSVTREGVLIWPTDDGKALVLKHVSTQDIQTIGKGGQVTISKP